MDKSSLQDENLAFDLVVDQVHQKLNLDGMDFLQFVLFLRDIECPLVAGPRRKNWKAAFEIFKSTCEFKGRQKLGCDDFVEAARKFRLVPTLGFIEVAMHDREIEIAGRMLEKLKQAGRLGSAPPFLLETAARRKLKGVPLSELPDQNSAEKKKGC